MSSNIFIASTPLTLTAAAINLSVPLLLTLPLWISFYAAILKYNDFINSKEWRNSDANIPEVFDFIIVGGGSSGAVVANRLSKHNKVLLLELGGTPLVISKLQSSMLLQIRAPGTDLLYDTVEQNNLALGLNNKKIFYPRGTGIGGSSNINGLIYQRGNPNDYDNWANITNNTEWAFTNVLKYFKKLETYNGSFKNKYHGVDGPMHIESSRHTFMEKYFLEASKEKGYQIKDLNGWQTAGFAPSEVTARNGLRWTTYNGYIEPIEKTRKNLHVYRYARVTKIHLDKNKRAYGLTFYRHGLYRFVRVRKEIVLSAGAVDTPKLLLLSGIGPKKHLKSVGLKCRANLPVGENLMDHPFTIFGPFLVDARESFLVKDSLKFRSITDFLSKMRSGILATSLVSGIGTVPTSVRNYDKSWPDIQFTLLPLGIFDGIAQIFGHSYNVKTDLFEKYIDVNENKGKDANFVAIALVRPKSKGYIRLANRNPFSDPLIQPNYFTHPDDMKSMVEGLRILVDLYENTTAYNKINARLTENKIPGCEKFEAKSDEYYECFVRHITFTIYHPVGTAAMGEKLDGKSVVDSELRVFKTKGLRVIDASIMPEIVNANTNIPCVMIGEIGSDFIKRYWQEQYLVTPLFEGIFWFHQIQLKCFYSKLS